MPKTAQQLSNEFKAHVKSIEFTRKKIETLFVEKEIVERDLNFAYSGLYIELVTSFERFIEELFIGLLSRTIIHRSRSVFPRTMFSTSIICRDVITGGKPYVDWLPYDSTLKRAAAYFRQGKPFSALDESDTKEINRILCIRNAIAHKSKYSYDKFERKVLSGISLTKKERKPIGFLRSAYILSPLPRLRFEEIEINLMLIAEKLTK